MAMNSSVLGEAIGNVLYNAIPEDVRSEMTAAAKAHTCSALIDAWTDISDEIIKHIKTYAVVNAGIAVTAGSCTGATTATGTIS